MKLFNKKIKRNKDTGTPIERYIKSFFHAVDGIAYSIKEEHNIIIILICAILAILLSIYFKIDTNQFLFIIGIIGAIMASELINTAIEATIDISSPEYSNLAKIAKDTASSATLILCVTALIGGIIIFLPLILEMR